MVTSETAVDRWINILCTECDPECGRKVDEAKGTIPHCYDVIKREILVRRLRRDLVGVALAREIERFEGLKTKVLK